ncbi:hypothetical protein ACQP1W_37135 [Spirillospora sp. CA-255316]
MTKTAEPGAGKGGYARLGRRRCVVREPARRRHNGQIVYASGGIA